MIIQEGSVFAGRYRLERALAQGGMGSVWVAQHTQLDVQLAIKFMDPTFAASAEARARFEREAKAAAKLQSPNVVRVHDYGVEDGTPYIVMERLVGEDLEARLEREGRLSPATTASIVTQTAKALRRAHEEGIVHRDLKPGNIFLVRDHDDEVVKVLDFGIAKEKMAADGGVTKTGMLIGSPHYMSPEQARSGKGLDHRSDLWSLGVIMFRALTGRLPFLGNELADVFMAICVDPIPIPSRIDPDLDSAVDAFFERALARDPSARFQSAREMAEAFAALSGMPSPRSSLPSLPPLAEEGFSDAVSYLRAVPLLPMGSLAPMGASIAQMSSVPARRRTAPIVAAILGGIALLCGVGLVLPQGSVTAPPRPAAMTTVTREVPAPPPATPAPPPPPAVVDSTPPSPPVTVAPPAIASAKPPAASSAKALPGLPKKKDAVATAPTSNPLLGF